MSLGDLKQMSIARDISETSQKYLKRHDIFVMSLRRLKYISKKMSFLWRFYNVFIFQKGCLSRDVSETSQKHLFQVFVIFQKYPKNMVSCDFWRVIKISDKIDVQPLETLKKWNIFWEHCIAINQVSNRYQWVDICVRVLTSQR